MPPLIVQVERTTEQMADTIAFQKSPVRIGRNVLNDLQLDEPFVSQWHAVIRFTEGRTFYLDLGSTNRTLINGKPIERNVEVPIDSDTDIRIGTLRLHTLRTDAPPELFGRKRKSAFAQHGVNADGRDEPPTVQLSVDAFHAELLAMRNKGSQTRTGLSADAALKSLFGEKRKNGVSAAANAAAARPSAPAVRPSAPAAKRVDAPPAMPASPRLNEALEAARASRPPPAGNAPDLQGWLARLTGGRLDTSAEQLDVERTMERVGTVLEVFSQAFLELRRAQMQFCHEMAIEHHSDDSPLQRTDDPRALLAYLLASDQEAGTRLTELSRALADFALHQVGLLSATVEGGRKLVQILAPDGLAHTQDPPADSPALTHHRPYAKLWPRAARKLWHRYLAHHFDLADGDRFVRELFGREFARRYYAVTGAAASGAPNHGV